MSWSFFYCLKGGEIWIRLISGSRCKSVLGIKQQNKLKNERGK